MVVYPVLFPESISAGAVYIPEHSTTMGEGPAGRVETQANWPHSRHRYDCSWDIASRQELEVLLNHFGGMLGSAYGFLFHDHSDDTVEMDYADGTDVLTHTGNVYQFGTGDGSRTLFQLNKRYGFAAANVSVRPITRPVASTVKIYKKVAGNWVLQVLTTDYALDDTTGGVTFVVAPTNGQQIGWAGQFYVPVHIENEQPRIRLDHHSAGRMDGIILREIFEDGATAVQSAALCGGAPTMPDIDE
jgi:uncharacterized protein (TIGR02217 family)